MCAQRYICWTGVVKQGGVGESSVNCSNQHLSSCTNLCQASGPRHASMSVLHAVSSIMNGNKDCPPVHLFDSLKIHLESLYLFPSGHELLT
ncbi:hypothetical protein ElyMa_004561900 [Elysia marginata]|uniref:Uncharacterized protein n=1 Tax=Elysia marginata TaxID=1093978 RepID=A0AAV4HSM6_9GAST|nr:hypothetical protein ElyMa_004561900 [Elysia marginata]